MRSYGITLCFPMRIPSMDFTEGQCTCQIPCKVMQGSECGSTVLLRNICMPFDKETLRCRSPTIWRWDSNIIGQVEYSKWTCICMHHISQDALPLSLPCGDFRDGEGCIHVLYIRGPAFEGTYYMQFLAINFHTHFLYGFSLVRTF